MSGMRSFVDFLDSAGDDLADDSAHAAADEGILHRAHIDGLAIHFAAGVHDGVVRPLCFLRSLQTSRIGLQVHELQRVGGTQAAIFQLESRVQQLRDARACVHPKMLVALRADVEVFFQVFFPDDLAALFALHPKPFGLDLLLARSIQFLRLPLEPRHRSFSVPGCQFSIVSAETDGQLCGTSGSDSLLRQYSMPRCAWMPFW